MYTTLEKLREHNAPKSLLDCFEDTSKKIGLAADVVIPLHAYVMLKPELSDVVEWLFTTPSIRVEGDSELDKAYLNKLNLKDENAYYEYALLKFKELGINKASDLFTEAFTEVYFQLLRDPNSNVSKEKATYEQIEHERRVAETKLILEKYRVVEEGKSVNH